MKAILFFLRVFIAVLGLTACAQFDVRSGYKLDAASRNGVLALGITANDEMPNFHWKLRKVGAKDSKDLTFFTNQNPLMWTNPRGRLAMIELEEGEYELFDWKVVFGLTPTQYFRIPFSVKAGRVTYLGRVHLAVNKTDMRFRIESTNGLFSNDLLLLKEKLPGLDESLIDGQQAAFQGCTEALCEKPSQAPRQYTIIIPIVVRSK